MERPRDGQLGLRGGCRVALDVAGAVALRSLLVALSFLVCHAAGRHVSVDAEGGQRRDAATCSAGSAATAGADTGTAESEASQAMLNEEEPRPIPPDEVARVLRGDGPVGEQQLFDGERRWDRGPDHVVLRGVGGGEASAGAYAMWSTDGGEGEVRVRIDAIVSVGPDALSDRNADGRSDLLVYEATGGSCFACRRVRLLQRGARGDVFDLLATAASPQRWPVDVIDSDGDRRFEVIAMNTFGEFLLPGLSHAASPVAYLAYELLPDGSDRFLPDHPIGKVQAWRHKHVLRDTHADDVHRIVAAASLGMLQTGGGER